MSYTRQTLAFVLCSLIVMPARATEPDPMRLLLSRDHWSSFNWASAEQSELWRLPGWVPDAEELHAEIGWRGTWNFSSWGMPFSARLESSDPGNQFPPKVKLDTVLFRRSQCDEVAKRFADAFGTPIENELSVYLARTETAYMRTDFLDHQWDIGETRVSASCFGMVSDRDEGLDMPRFAWSIRFEHLPNADRLVPKFAMTCSRRMASVDEAGAPKDVGSIAFWVNPATSQVLTPAFTMFAKLAQIDAGSIRFEHRNGAQVSRYEVDRSNGRLAAGVFSEGKLVGTLTGECEVVPQLEETPSGHSVGSFD